MVSGCRSGAELGEQARKLRKRALTAASLAAVRIFYEPRLAVKSRICDGLGTGSGRWQLIRARRKLVLMWVAREIKWPRDPVEPAQSSKPSRDVTNRTGTGKRPMHPLSNHWEHVDECDRSEDIRGAKRHLHHRHHHRAQQPGNLPGSIII